MQISIKTDHTSSALKKSLKIPSIPGFSLLQTTEMASLLNSRWQNRKERSNRSTNNGDMDEIAKHPVTFM